MADHKKIIKELRKRHRSGDGDRVGVSATPMQEVSVKTNGEQVIVQAVANTAAVDLAEEVLIPKGADPTYFRDYKTIYYNHDDDRPVGKLIDMTLVKGDSQWFVRMQMSQATELARGVSKMIEEGVINGTSVGFYRKEWGPPTEDEKSAYGEHHTIVRKWKWLELSITPMPCNPDAMIQSGKSLKLSQGTLIDLGVPKEAFAFDGRKVSFTTKPKVLRFGDGSRRKGDAV